MASGFCARDIHLCARNATMPSQAMNQLPTLTCRSMVVHLRLGVFLFLMSMSACSHTQPYMRPTVAQPGSQAPLQSRIVLFGDGGAPDCHPAQNAQGNEPDCAHDLTLQTLVSRASVDPQKTTILFLGDNIYREGLPEVQEQDKY